MCCFSRARSRGCLLIVVTSVQLGVAMARDDHDMWYTGLLRSHAWGQGHLLAGHSQQVELLEESKGNYVHKQLSLISSAPRLGTRPVTWWGKGDARAAKAKPYFQKKNVGRRILPAHSSTVTTSFLFPFGSRPRNKAKARGYCDTASPLPHFSVRSVGIGILTLHRRQQPSSGAAGCTALTTDPNPVGSDTLEVRWSHEQRRPKAKCLVFVTLKAKLCHYSVYGISLANGAVSDS
jgi:hypothetical protein